MTKLIGEKWTLHGKLFSLYSLLRPIFVSFRSACLSEDALLINDRYVVPFLPVNADLPATRNQRRQKLAKFNGREFAALLIDIVSEAKRRWLAAMGQVRRLLYLVSTGGVCGLLLASGSLGIEV